MLLTECRNKIRSSVQDRQQIIREIYQSVDFNNGLSAFIRAHQGSIEELANLKHETIVQFVKTMYSDSAIKADGPVTAYLLGIAKFVWFSEMKRRNKILTNEIKEPEVLVSLDGFELNFISEEKSRALHKIMVTLRGNCKEVLMAWANGLSMKEIAHNLNYQSEGMARKKKSQCMKQLVEFIHSNPDLKSALSQ
ncbi:MAG: sigma-70 family RNA polymerase sigma factor [Saprospiraceae bacterium]